MILTTYLFQHGKQIIYINCVQLIIPNMKHVECICFFVSMISRWPIYLYMWHPQNKNWVKKTHWLLLLNKNWLNVPILKVKSWKIKSILYLPVTGNVDVNILLITRCVCIIWMEWISNKRIIYYIMCVIFVLCWQIVVYNINRLLWISSVGDIFIRVKASHDLS